MNPYLISAYALGGLVVLYLFAGVVVLLGMPLVKSWWVHLCRTNGLVVIVGWPSLVAHLWTDAVAGSATPDDEEASSP